MGSARPTLDTVAQAAGVSRMTVSNAYNRPDQLSAATRERVLAVATRLGYPGPDPAGRSLRRGRTGTIGIVLTESLSYAFTDPGLVSFLRGIADVLTAEGRPMLLVPTHSAPASQVLRDAMVDALVVCSLRDDDPVMEAVQRRGVPFLTVGSPRAKGRPFIGIDNAAAASLAADHLVALGHRRLAVLGLPPQMPLDDHGPIVVTRPGFQLRAVAFVARCVALGVDPAAITVVTARTNSPDAGHETAPLLMSGELRPTAIFAVSDALALGVLAAATDSGHRVPGDLSVVGFDGIDEGRHSRPPLTTVDQDLRDQGRRAARLTLSMLAGGHPRSPRITPQLIVRASTAPPAR
jgi:DNA-binding LacI/PurR family transcriptional regulator